jgi:hypothetical protein
MESKVNTLMNEPASQKLLTATAISASKNTEVTNTILHDLFVKKSLVAKLQSELYDAQVNHLPLPEMLDNIKANIERLLDCTSSKGTHFQTKVRTVCESMLSDVYNSQCLPYLVVRTQGLVQRKNPYQRAMQIARSIDLSGLVLNLSSYDALRKGMEMDADGKIETNGGWLVSKYYDMQAMTKVKVAAQAVVPFYPLPPASGIDGIYFDYEKLLLFLLKLYRLDKVELDPDQPVVEFSFTLDGADLSRNISDVTTGIKINDPCAIDPISGIPIGMEDSRKVQNRELCYACKILIAKDSKTLYDSYYSDLFTFFRQVNKEVWRICSEGEQFRYSLVSLHYKFSTGLIVRLEADGKEWRMQAEA